jgi:hypothetical protein
LPGPPLCPVQDLGSFACQVFHASGMVCCLQHSVRVSQRTPRGPKIPLHQVPDHVEVPSLRLSCRVATPSIRLTSMALNRVDTVVVNQPAQPLSDVLNAQLQLLNHLAGCSQYPSAAQLLLVCSFHDSPHLLMLMSVSNRLLFSGCSLLLLRLSITRPSAGILSLGPTRRSGSWWSRLLAGS